ncbi:MerR family transcriptional regulator [bacterium]|nr:MerR family transcriptional regulator [bacterium]
MGAYRISQLARSFGLSRSTLLYYDRIGLLSPAARTPSGYRAYGERDRDRLERIRRYREAGFSVSDIRLLLRPARTPPARILERRLQEIDEEIVRLRAQQRLLAGMVHRLSSRRRATSVDRAGWVAMLRGAGLDEAGMRRWHAEFELRAPRAHHQFLRELGIEDRELRAIRAWARSGGRR